MNQADKEYLQKKGLLRKVSWLVYVGPRFVLAKQLMPSLLMLSAGSNPNSTALFAIVGSSNEGISNLCRIIAGEGKWCDGITDYIPVSG